MRDPAIEAAQRMWPNHPAERFQKDGMVAVQLFIAGAREALDPLRMWHRKDTDGYCITCDSHEWPCPTSRLIYAEGEL